MGTRRIGALLAIVAASALAAAAAPAGAAIPASGTVVEGSGPAAVTIGTPAAVAIGRWGLVCRVVSPASKAKRCFSSLNRAINWVEISGAGRVSALIWGEGGWRTRRGVGLGSSIAAVKSAYRGSLKVRTTKVWTYMTLRKVVRGQVRVTGFLGRTKVGDVVQLYVLHERRRLLATDPATVPSGQGFFVVLTDWAPREPVEIEIQMPWEATFGESIGKVAVGRDGRGRRRVAGTGLLAGLLARRPAGTLGPVVARVGTGNGIGDLRATVRLELPAPPAIAVSPGVLPADGTAQLTVTGAEASGRYELDAEWTCPLGANGRRQGIEEDEITAPLGGTITAALDASTVNFGLFDEACAGPAPPEALPATLVLVRVGVGRGSASESRERVAAVPVQVARV